MQMTSIIQQMGKTELSKHLIEKLKESPTPAAQRECLIM